jgi:hypothetical protein
MIASLLMMMYTMFALRMTFRKPLEQKQRRQQKHLQLQRYTKDAHNQSAAAIAVQRHPYEY